MKCVQCQMYYERTTEFFHFNNGGRNIINSEPGHENLRNSISNPCRKCFKNVCTSKHATQEGFTYILLRRYPELTREWFDKTLSQQNFRGLITNMLMDFIPNGKNCIGVHKRNNKLEHIPENCFLEVQELNVAQWEAIPCLTEAWTKIFEFLVKKFEMVKHKDSLQLFQEEYTKTLQDLGLNSRENREEYLKQRKLLHFKTILRSKIEHHIQADIVADRFTLPDNIREYKFIDIVYPNVIAKIEEQGGCCGYTGIGLTYKRNFNQFSFDRQDNNLPHFTQDGKLPNCILVCRLFNASRHLSEKMILEYFLEQQLVKLPVIVRKRAQTKLSQI